MPAAPAVKEGALPPFPERLGRYELLLPIGTGGMATVYLARSRGVQGFEREVALKLTHPHLRDEPEWTGDLVEEAKLASRVRHPNVVDVLDVGDDPHGVFMVMEYVEGDVLSALLKALPEGERVPLPIALRIVDDALTGLHAAHELRDEQGEPLRLVHRDFTPQNILVGLDGHTRLTDFGIAKVANQKQLTRTGLVKGKLRYMAPEQARGQTIDRRTDVWAAGVVLWELLAGRRLYAREDETATLLRLISEDPPRLCTVRPDLPRAFDEAIAGALTRDVTARTPTAEALRLAIESAGPRASTAEVGAYVAGLVADKLEGRRRRIAQVLALRAEMNALVELPADASSSSGGPRGDEDTHLQEAPPESVRDGVSSSVRGVHAGNGVGPERSRRGAALAIGAAVLAALGAVIVVATTREPSGDTPTHAGAAGGDDPREAPLASPDPGNEERTADAVTSSLPQTVATLTIAGDAPIAQLTIGGRTVVLAAPNARVTAELVGAERAAESLPLTVVSVDRRRSSVTARPRDGVVDIHFDTTARAPARAPARAQRPARPTPPTEARPARAPLAKDTLVP